MANRLAVIGGKIVTPSAVIENGVVLVEDGKITFVGSATEAQPEPGSRIVDAAGGVVMPGFIDTHSHARRQIFEETKAENYIRQGVTTAIDLIADQTQISAMDVGPLG